MFFDANVLNVVVKAGASFQVQKSRTIMMVKEMMGMSPLFAQFIAEKGLQFVLDNMEGKGIEQLKELVDGWLQELQQQKQMQMQQQQQEMQNNPLMMKNQLAQQKLIQDENKMQNELALDMAKLEHDKNKILADLKIESDKQLIQALKASTERFAKQIDLRIKHMDVAHKHANKAVETHHKLTKGT